MSNFLVFATQLFSMFHCLILLFLGYYILVVVAVDVVVAVANMLSLQFTVVYPHISFISCWCSVFYGCWLHHHYHHHQLGHQITNVSHKILKFNKFSSINFNLVSRSPLFYCDFLDDRSYVYFLFEIWFAWSPCWSYGQDHKSIMLHSMLLILHLSIFTIHCFV